MPEPVGFNLFSRLQHQELQVVVQGAGGRQPLQPCKVEMKKVGWSYNNRCSALQRPPNCLGRRQGIAGIEPNELFDQIQQRNTLALVNLLRDLQGVAGDVASRLRSGCLDQLAALSHHYGKRDDLLNKSSAS